MLIIISLILLICQLLPTIRIKQKNKVNDNVGMIIHLIKGENKMRKSIHVTYREKDGNWHIVKGDSNRSASNYKTQKDAIQSARQMAMESSSELCIHGADGKIRKSTSYGNDPRRIKG